ncbi:nicotinamide N-methyltransferase-like [Pelobates fuscus]|uniref:nicotinamide N-methyltransferase-like n=1 Tax=Pelobates fuscus TaxID=191477 RepID=UPI002FE47EC8
MAFDTRKHYHEEELDPCLLVRTYASAEVHSDFRRNFVEYPMKTLFDFFSSDIVKGDTLMDFSIGPSMCFLMSAADYFKEIITLESSEACKIETEKWLRNDPDAIDWSDSAMFACELKGERDQWKEQQEKVRGAVKRVIKWDVTQDDPVSHTVLPEVDCLSCVWYLHVLSKHHDMLTSYLKKLSSFLKVGGHMILFFALNMSYYWVGEHTFFSLNCSEEVILKALRDAGCSLVMYEKNESKLDTHMVDLEHLGHFVARKEREL